MNSANNKLSFLFQDTPLIRRIFGFFTIFIVVSGTLGPRIINHGLVGTDGFGVYGYAGKSLVFASLGFGLFVHKKWHLLKTVSWSCGNIAWFVLTVVFYISAELAITQLQAGVHGLLWPLLTHIGILFSIATSAIGIIGLANFRNIYRLFKSELLIACSLGVGFYVFLKIVYGLWRFLATIVIHAVSWLLGLSGLFVVVLPHNVLLLDKFSVAVSEYCSGIESIALFTGLYVLIGIIDRDKLNFHKFYAVFLPALVLLFGCNILRVYGLVMAGYYINPRIAFSLFHTYAGLVFFVLYSALFWWLAYKWMLKLQIIERIENKASH